MLLIDFDEGLMLEPGSHNTFKELLENHLLSPPKTDEPPAPLYPLISVTCAVSVSMLASTSGF